MAYSKVERKMWNDERFRSWNRDARDAWQYLLTTPHQDGPAARLGCIILDPLYAAADLSAPDDPWTRERVEEQLAFFHETGRIVWDPSVRVVLLCNYFDHNKPENPNVAKSIAAAVDELPFSETLLEGLAKGCSQYLPARFESKADQGKPCGELILAAIQERLEKARQEQHSNRSDNPSERLSKAFRKGLGNPEPEPEPEPEPSTTTVPIGTEPGARGAARSNGGPRGGRGPRPRTAEDLAVNAAIAGAVRQHFWIGGKPPAHVKAPNGKPWSMKNELSTARVLLKAEAGRYTVEDLVGAIEVARAVLRFEPDEPLTLRLFTARDRPEVFQRCADYWRSRETRKAARETLEHFHVEVRHGS